jgi:virginiamycin B lyase
MARLTALFARGLAALVVLATLLLATSPAQAGLTLWPTCTAPPAGDFARCEHGAFPQSIVGGPDGAMWFTTARSDLGRVTTAGAFAQVDVPLGAGGQRLLGGLTVGPDGNLWFPAASGMPYLYRATPASPPVFTATLNPGDTQPRQAALGPDGAIWLAEAKSNTLGRFVPATGAYTSFPLPAKPAGTFVGPLGVANGPDGRLWVARPQDVLAVTPAGVTTTYAIPGVGPEQVAPGPDGAMWVAGFATDNIARITTGGAVTVFPLPAGARPESITTGPDGALWIGLGGASGIMRMTTAGAWTVTPLMFGSQVSSITTGPDGAIWFADLAGSRVGRLTTGVLSAPAVVSLSPSVGPPGTVIRVDGERLSGARAVTIGGRAATFKRSGSGLSVTVPAGAGAAPVVVTTAAGRSPATDAATFSFATAAVPAPAAPPVTAAPTVTLGSASLAADGTLTVSVRTTAAVPFDLAAALSLSGKRATISSAAAKLTLPRAGTAKGHFTRTGGARVRLHLSASARRAIARRGTAHVQLEVGVRLRLGGGQTSVGQRTYRLRTG